MCLFASLSKAVCGSHPVGAVAALEKTGKYHATCLWPVVFVDRVLDFVLDCIFDSSFETLRGYAEPQALPEDLQAGRVENP